MDVRVDVSEGEAALDSAQPGGRVIDGRGEWTISHSLTVPTGVEFCGEAQTETLFRSTLDIPTNQAIGAKNVVLRD